MYPDFQYLFHGLFGINAPAWLSLFKTFGFFVAIAFICAAWVLIKELKRKEAQGLLIPEFTSITIGKPIKPIDLFWSALTGFILGFKIGGIIGNVAQVTPNPVAYLFSMQGSILGGIIGALLIAGSRYYESKKQQLPEPVTKRVAIYPHQRISEMVVIAAVGGILGAKVFNAFETWDSFIKDPIGSIISPDGLTFYGGLIVAATVMYFFAKKHKIPFRHLCDAMAPALLLAYGVGRLGCHFSGDGDWGIFNTAYISTADGNLKLADTSHFYHQILPEAGTYLKAHYGMNYFNVLPHINYPAPGWAPRWLFAMNYPHNVNNDGIMIANCGTEGLSTYCRMLPVGVFPTSAYEAIACIGLFFALWSARKRIKYGWHMFGIYLIINGIERFTIEKIRVNYKYNFGFIHPTQAEIISTLLVVAGVCLLVFYKKKNEPLTEPSTT